MPYKILPMKKRLFAGCAFASLMIASPSFSQDEETSDANTNEVKDEIIVTGLRGSLGRAIGTKRDAQGIVDSISAEDLGKFPDLNLSESLQRIPGVTLNRNPNGEGEAINLRGLASQFTRVEINGITALGNGADQNINGRLGGNGGGREFNFEILPAELFTSAKVFKTSRASQSEGGLAGVVSLETPRPLDSDGFKFVTSAQGNYGGKANSLDPRAFATISNNWNDKFGVAAAFAYSNTDFRSDSIEIGTHFRLADIVNNVADGDEFADVIVPRTPRLFSFVEERENYAGTLDFQFRPSDNLEFFMSGLYGNLTNERNVIRPDAVAEGGQVSAVLNDPNNPLIVGANGVANRITFDATQQRPSSRLTDIDDEIYQISGGVNYTANNWTVSPYVGYSRREADREFSLLSFRANNPDGSVLNGPGSFVTVFQDGDNFSFESALTDLRSNPEDFSLNVLIFRPTVDIDENFETKLDITREFDEGPLRNVKFGMRYNDRTKDVTAGDFRLVRTVLPDATAGFADVASFTDFEVDGSDDLFSQNGEIFLVDPDLYLDVYFPQGGFDPGEFDGSVPTLAGTAFQNRPGAAASNTYNINESTFNAYGELNLDWDIVSINLGLRYVTTDQTSEGFQVTNQNLPTEVILPVTLGSGYDEFLPSFSVRYEPIEDVVLRAAYSSTITRANLPDLAPSETIFAPTSVGQGNRGNPELLPFTSDNIDLGAEWYFEPEGFIAVNFFYKDITNLIGDEITTETQTFVTQLGDTITDGEIIFTTPVNAAAASVLGFEFSVQKPFTFLSGEFLQDFGALFNYTYTDSSADFGNEGDIRNDGLPGLSENSFNASVYYDNGSLDARLSYAWRDQFLAAFSDDFGLPRFTDSFGQLDFRANYAVTDNIQLQLQALNITGENIVSQAFVEDVGFLPYGNLDITRRVIFGARYSF